MSIRRSHFLVISTLVTVGVFSYLLSHVSVADVAAAISGISLPWVLLFVVFSLAMSLFRTWRYDVLLQVSGYKVRSLPLFLVTLVRNFFSDLLPARLGTLIYIYLIRSRLNVPLAPAMTSFAYAFLFDIISLALLLFPAVLLAGAGERSSLVIVVAGALLAVAGAIIVWWLAPLSAVATTAISKISFLPEKWRLASVRVLAETRDNLEHLQQSGIYLHILGLSFAVRLCKYISLYFLLMGLVIPLGYSVAGFPAAKVFLGLCSAELASSLPVSGIAGFGAYEGAWALVFQLLGYPEKLAVLTSVSHHLLTQLYGYGLGGVAMALLLLPVLKHKEDRPHEVAGPVLHYFWLKMGAATLVLTVVTVLMLTAIDTGSADSQLTPAGQQVSQGNEKTVKGRVVYERPDGIYVTDLASGRTGLLAKNGSHPRWSPDGKLVTFVRGKDVMLAETDGSTRVVASGSRLRAVCFSGDGRWVYFTDGKVVRRVSLFTGEVELVVRDSEFFEIDISNDGTLLAATVKTLTGYKVKVYNLPRSTSETASRGCSASLSPDGSQVTVNGSEHKKLYLLPTAHSSAGEGYIRSPAGLKFDNQFWSNHPDWLASTGYDQRGKDIFIHHRGSGEVRRVTSSGDCDRADLFVKAVVQ